MRYGLFAIILSILAGCTVTNEYVTSYPYISAKDRHDGDFYSHVNTLSYQVLEGVDIYEGDTLAVTSLVNLDKLNYTDSFGRQLGESMFTSLQGRGLTLKEIRLANSIQLVSEQGEFALSRTAEKLAPQLHATYILVGTYQGSESGYHVNVRIIELATQKVAGSGYHFFPSAVAPLERSVREEQGRIIREDIR